MHQHLRRSRTLALFFLTLLWISGLPLVHSHAQGDGGEVSPVPETTSSDDANPSSQFERQLDGPVLIGEVDGEINQVASAYIVRLVRQAEEQGAKTLVLQLNTFGGAVISAVAIRDVLLDTDLHTVVYIDKRAISAGALISFACDTIAISPGGTIGAAAIVAQSPAGEEPSAVDEKYVSYFREEMRSTAEANGRNPDIAEAMVDEDKEIEGISPAGKLLTLSTRSALEHGIADLQADDIDALLATLGLADAEQSTLESNWSENLVGFLTSPAVSGVLFLVMFVLAYLEYQTPGFGVFGFGALACFLVLYFSHYLVNLAGWEELILFLLGVILLVVEIFVLPGFGFAGVAGLLCILASGTLMLMAGDWSDLSFDNPLTREAMQRVTLSMVLGFVVLLFLIRLLPQDTEAHGDASGLFLGKNLDKGEGYASHEADVTETADLTGTTGTALTPLRPAGRARFGDQRLEVQTEGEFLDTGSTLTVLRHEGGRVIVRARDERGGEGAKEVRNA